MESAAVSVPCDTLVWLQPRFVTRGTRLLMAVYEYYSAEGEEQCVLNLNWYCLNDDPHIHHFKHDNFLLTDI